jgi:hypothetical protein
MEDGKWKNGLKCRAESFLPVDGYQVTRYIVSLPRRRVHCAAHAAGGW